MGAASDNAAILPSIASQAVGLKMYLNDTYSTLKMDNVSLWMEVGFHSNTKETETSGCLSCLQLFQFSVLLHSVKLFF